MVGARLASLALTPEMAAEIGRFSGRPLDVIHDEGTAGVPWEALCFAAAQSADPSVFPGLHGGVRRRLSVNAAEVSRPVGTSSETRRVLLIVNPLGDLDSAAKEGDALEALLKSMPGLVVEVLRGPEATVEALNRKLEEPWDVLHYAGHAFFDSATEGESGLVLFGRNTFDAELVRSLKRPPPFVFLNACQSARVRDFLPVEEGEEPAKKNLDVSGAHGAMARAFLTAGTRLFIGNFWLVGDDAAREVARVTYEQLLKGAPIGAALLSARKELFAAKNPDWANYVLYGDAAWRW